MVKYVDDKCCHVSRLHLVMGNIWNKVIHPRLLQHLGDGTMNNVVGKNTLLVGWGVLFGEIIGKIFISMLPNRELNRSEYPLIVFCAE